MVSPEALARTCARQPWRVVGAWLVVVVVAVGLVVTLLGSALVTENDVTTRTESKRADELLEERLPEAVFPDWEYLIARAPSAEPVAAALRDAGFRPVGGPQRSPDGSVVVVPFALDGVPVEQAIPVAERFDGALFGGEIVDRDFHEVSERDLRVAETFGVATALVVLVIVFGALVAALVPLALAGIAIVVALAGSALIGQAFELSVFVTNMVAGMGLALGIDYSLFVLSRFREERRAGRDVEEAIVAAGQTASRAVLFSGTAVGIALGSMLLVPDSVLRSLATGAVLVALASVAAALTLLPALLRLLGDRIDRLSVPFIGGAGVRAEGRFWGAVARRVMRRPLASLVAATAVLLLAAAPVLGLETGAAGVSTLPDRTEAKQGFNLLNEAFGSGSVRPTDVVVVGDVAAAEEAIASLRDALRRDPLFMEPRVVVHPEREVALLSSMVAGDQTGDEALAAVDRLREEYIPAAGFPDGVELAVGGFTAANLDYVRASNASRPLVFLFVLGLSLVLLTVAFRSIVVPLKAIAINLLSVGAAYGLLALVFDGPIEVWVPLLLFALLFGLSMDYHVFLLSRIRERYRESGDNARAVEFGIASTARIITGAALIIVVVFTGFTLSELEMFRQMGFGVAVALLIDATIVRVVLVPAAMRLLGGRNWYLPSWLRWLPELTVEKAERAGRGP